MSNLRFELATIEHLDAVLTLVERYYRSDHIGFNHAAIHHSLHTLLTNAAHGRVWLINLDDTLLGYVVLTFGFDHEFGGRVGTITDLYIETSYRGRGLGAATLGFVEKQAAELRLSALELQVEQDNAAALALYRKIGYVTHTRIPMSKRILL